MPNSSMSTVILHLRKTMCLQDDVGVTDAHLLERFIEHRDEAAFAALVRRHGSMVMGVCLRVVRNRQDAEDAFQATFLVLVRKAASISSRGLLANWLYGVAYNTALKAKAVNIKRQAKEKQVIEMPDPPIAGQEPWSDDLQALLDQELNGLPEKYRIPIILCDLEGKTRKEAAKQLGCPEGSLSSRLSRARVMLAKRLAHHGLAVSGGSLAAALSQNVASACVPTSVACGTIKAATLYAAGQAATGVVSAKVAALTEGVLKTMLLSKLKIATIVLLILSIVGFGAGTFIHEALAEKKQEAKKEELPKPAEKPQDEKQPRKERSEKNWRLQEVDLTKRTIKVSKWSFLKDEEGQPISGTGAWMVLQVDPTTKIMLDGKEANLADLKKDHAHSVNMEFELASRNDQETKHKAIRIEVIGEQVGGVIQAVNFGKNTVTFLAEDEGTDTKETTYSVAKDATLVINGKQTKFAQLKPKMRVSLQMSAVKLLVVGVTAAGPKVEGVVKAVNASANTITVSIKSTHLAVEGIPVAKDAKVIIDGKDGKLSELKAGMRVTLQMSAEMDQSFVVGIATGNVTKK